MTNEEFYDMTADEVNDAVEVSGIASKTAIVNGEEVPLVEYIWQDKVKPSVRIERGIKA